MSLTDLEFRLIEMLLLRSPIRGRAPGVNVEAVLFRLHSCDVTIELHLGESSMDSCLFSIQIGNKELHCLPLG